MEKHEPPSLPDFTNADSAAVKMEAQPIPQHRHDNTDISSDPEKKSLISAACDRNDVAALRDLASSENGLLADDLRRRACTEHVRLMKNCSTTDAVSGPILLGYTATDDDVNHHWKELPVHKDEEQVHLDVHRSFVYYPTDETDAEKDFHKRELNQVITAVLRMHPMLHYFQGYHDIVQVLLLVLGREHCIPAVERLSLLRIRDFMLPTMSGTEHHLRLLPAILSAADPTVYQHLSQTQPFFALAATLTLYAHDIEEYGDIARLFDFLLAREAVVTLYLFAVIVIARKEELLQIEPDEPEMLHAILSKLPKPLDLNGLIQSSIELYKRFPPESLPWRAWQRVSSNSVLKTTHSASALAGQQLTDGERFFAAEAEEIRRADEWKRRQIELRRLARRYKRPAAYTGAAVIVAVFALLARTRAADTVLLSLGPAAGRLAHVARRTVSTILQVVAP